MVRFLLSVGLATALLLSGTVWPASRVAAQSILKRLEQEIRQRVAEDRAAAQPAESQPQRTPGYLGAIVDDRQDRGRGVRVLEVRPEGPAAVAGMHVGDLITGVAGVRVRQTEDLADVMAVFPPGSRVAFDVLREGQVSKIDVVLGHRESPEDTPLARPEAVPLPLPEPMADPVEPASRLDASAQQPAAPLNLSPAQPTPPESAAGPGSNSEIEVPAPPVDRNLLEQLQARIAELERRVERLERALAESEDKTGPALEK